MFLNHHRYVLLGVLCLSMGGSAPAEQTYTSDISKWVEVKAPPKSDMTEWYIFSSAANHSKHEWNVELKNGKPFPQLIERYPSYVGTKPPFKTVQKGIGDGYAFEKVSDGWLVGFNAGEWGGALYWCSENGSRNYKISDSQIVSYYRIGGAIYAIEGLSHMSISEGSVIQIRRNDKAHKWTERQFAKLPYAPEIACVHKDGTVTIATSDSIESVDGNGKTQTLFGDAPWPMFYPRSAVLSSDEKKLYIGMREYVGEFDFSTKKLRLLAPSLEYRNRLPKDQEAMLRKVLTESEKTRKREKAKQGK